MTDKLQTVTPIEDFDWDAYAKGEVYTKENREQLTESYDNTLSKISDKEVVTGTVTSMNKREVVVNIGFKSDGVVSMNEFRYNPELKIGDEVEIIGNNISAEDLAQATQTINYEILTNWKESLPRLVC